MPHLRIDYCGSLDAHSDMQSLCAGLARALAALEDGAGKAVFPLLGTRVLAYPAPHHAVADGAPDKVFVYLNLRITAGRDAALVAKVGEALMAQVDTHFAPLRGQHPIRVTLHIDEGQPVYEGKWAS